MRTLIISVGTSLQQNWRRAHDQVMPSQEALLAYLTPENGRQASAESNTLEQLPLHDDDRLIWMHSDTTEGRTCAEALHAHYSDRGWRSELRPIGGLGYHEKAFAERGLRQVVATACEIIRDAGARHEAVEICATGGFKAEIAYLNLVGMLFGVPVHYIHEQFRDLVTLPPLPLDWNIEWLTAHEAFFAWIREDLRATPDVHRRLHAARELPPLIVDDPEGYSYLNAAGELLYQAYLERRRGSPHPNWPEPSTAAPEDKWEVSKTEHHRPEGWRAFVTYLTQIPYVMRVRHDSRIAIRGGKRPSVFTLPGEWSAIGVIYGSSGDDLPLRVEITAHNQAQAELVRGHIERSVRKW